MFKMPCPINSTWHSILHLHSSETRVRSFYPKARYCICVKSQKLFWSPQCIYYVDRLALNIGFSQKRRRHIGTSRRQKSCDAVCLLIGSLDLDLCHSVRNARIETLLRVPWGEAQFQQGMVVYATLLLTTSMETHPPNSFRFYSPVYWFAFHSFQTRILLGTYIHGYWSILFLHWTEMVNGN